MKYVGAPLTRHGKGLGADCLGDAPKYGNVVGMLKYGGASASVGDDYVRCSLMSLYGLEGEPALVSTLTSNLVGA